MRALFLLGLVGLPACSDYFAKTKDKTVGELVGAYAISAQADPASTCIEIVNASPRPWNFSISLRRDGTRAFWYSGPEPIEGTLDDKASTLSFKTSTRTLVHEADKKRELGACAIIRFDEFVGTLSADKKSFTGTLRYGYQLESGSDCRDVVGPVLPERPTPLFSTMPCAALYAVTASKTD